MNELKKKKNNNNNSPLNFYLMRFQIFKNQWPLESIRAICDFRKNVWEISSNFRIQLFKYKLASALWEEVGGCIGQSP